MTREIKFRGKRKDNGEWVYGYYARDQLEVAGDIIDMIVGMDLGWYVIIPETIGQYTNLKDKNGKEIYEGDVVQCDGNKDMWGEVAYQADYRTGFGYIQQGPTMRDVRHGEFDGGLTRFTVIGNVWENPELVE